jgi:hypothetical protein
MSGPVEFEFEGKLSPAMLAEASMVDLKFLRV